MANFRPAGMSDDYDSDEYDLHYRPNNGNPVQKSQHPTSSTTTDNTIRTVNAMSRQNLNRSRANENELVMACQNGSLPQLEKIITSTPDFNINKKIKLKTPLMYATTERNPIIVKYLLEQGAKAEVDDKEPILIVLTQGHFSYDFKSEDLLECANLLLDAGAKVNLKDKFLTTPLIAAVNLRLHKLAEFFLENGAAESVNHADNYSRTALDFAATNGDGRMARILLTHGADVNIVNNDGQLPYEIAYYKGHTLLSEILFKVKTTKWRPGEDPALLNFEIDEYQLKKQKKASLVNAEEFDQSQIRMILQNVGMEKYVDYFMEHKIGYMGLLRLNETQLIEMGVKEIGLRMKLLNEIRSIHNKEYKSSSILPITLQSKITSSEAACMIHSLRVHVELLGTTLTYLNDKATISSDSLEVGLETTRIEDLIEKLKKLEKSSKHLTAETKSLIYTLNKLKPFSALQIGDEKDEKRSNFIRNSSVIIGIAIILGLTYKRNSVQHILFTLFTKQA